MLHYIQMTFDLPITAKLLKANSIMSNLCSLYKYKGHVKRGKRIMLKAGEFCSTTKEDGHIYGVVRETDAESLTREIAALKLTSQV